MQADKTSLTGSRRDQSKGGGEGGGEGKGTRWLGPQPETSASTPAMPCSKLSLSPFFPCPTRPSVCLSLLSVWVSLPVLAICLRFTLLRHPGTPGPSLSPCVSGSLPAVFSPSLSFAVSAHGCLSAYLFGVAGRLSVRPLILGSWKHPLHSLMCGCEIPFEYCSSQLLVAKGTGQERWGSRGGHREPGGGCGHAFLFSSSLVRSFSKA